MDIVQLNKRYNWLWHHLERLIEKLIVRQLQALAADQSKRLFSIHQIHSIVRSLAVIYDHRRAITDDNTDRDEPSEADIRAAEEVSRRLKEIIELDDLYDEAEGECEAGFDPHLE